MRDTVELELYVVGRTDRAICVTDKDDFDFDADAGAWLPMSQIDIVRAGVVPHTKDDLRNGKPWLIAVPEWLAVREGLA